MLFNVLCDFSVEGIDSEVIYLDVMDFVLVKCFSEICRRYFISNDINMFNEVIECECDMLYLVVFSVSLIINISKFNFYELCDLIKKWVGVGNEGMVLLF